VLGLSPHPPPGSHRAVSRPQGNLRQPTVSLSKETFSNPLSRRIHLFLSPLLRKVQSLSFSLKHGQTILHPPTTQPSLTLAPHGRTHTVKRCRWSVASWSHCFCFHANCHLGMRLSQVQTLTLEEKVNITTGVGWMNGPCVGNIPPVKDFPGLCLEVRSHSSSPFPTYAEGA
jgi:hypothetical protein